jgi:hypothetical protein
VISLWFFGGPGSPFAHASRVVVWTLRWHTLRPSLAQSGMYRMNRS